MNFAPNSPSSIFLKICSICIKIGKGLSYPSLSISIFLSLSLSLSHYDPMSRSLTNPITPDPPHFGPILHMSIDKRIFMIENMKIHQ